MKYEDYKQFKSTTGIQYGEIVDEKKEQKKDAKKK